MKSKYDHPRAVCDKCGKEAPKLQNQLADIYPYDTSKPCSCGGQWCTTFEPVAEEKHR